MNSWRVLIADDDPLVLAMLGDSLEPLELTVLEARDGEEAVQVAKAEHPDLILLDVMMPRMDGYQAAALLKQDPETAEIPLIFVSALGASRDKVRGLSLGAEDYLSKPIDPEELRARVQMVLRRARPSPREAPMALGQLEAMNLVSLIQMFEGERRSARLLLARAGDRGEIVFIEGKITRAVQGPRQGEAAVYQLLGWQAGTFQMAPIDSASQAGGNIDRPNQALLMEGLRRLDETPGLRTGLSDPPVRMEIPAALRTGVKTHAQAEAAAVVGLLDGTRDLNEVLAQSSLDEWATLRILHSLRSVRGLVPADVSPERRGSTRLNVEIPIEYQSLQSFQKNPGFNLAASGVYIRTAVPYDMGDRVLLRFQLPGQETSVKLVGQVVWRNADPKRLGGMGMGIQFVDMSGADRESIEQYMAQSIAMQVSDVVRGQ